MKTAYKFRLYPNKLQESITRSYEDPKYYVQAEKKNRSLNASMGIRTLGLRGIASGEPTYGFGQCPK
jgi:hypothetical protein